MALVYNTPLSPAQQAVEGIDPVQPLAMADRVRYSELDILKHVNNTAYMEWFERLRIRYCSDWGMTDYQDTADNPRIVIRSGTIHFRQETFMNEDYIVTCACRAFRTSSYTLGQQIWSGGTLRATFDCVMVHLEHDGSARRPLPDDLRARFIAVDGATEEG
ncbi:acyl-CoA thioesterase [Marimonas sp. MJW-29]|uniref:Acyl-CoA thioesterase n=1 Tax=Sulfitobacter sediminis TaxID=3234186 RepID=A0ABV3RSC6_9RHOB